MKRIYIASSLLLFCLFGCKKESKLAGQVGFLEHKGNKISVAWVSGKKNRKLTSPLAEKVLHAFDSKVSLLDQEGPVFIVVDGNDMIVITSIGPKSERDKQKPPESIRKGRYFYFSEEEGKWTLNKTVPITNEEGSNKEAPPNE